MIIEAAIKLEDDIEFSPLSQPPTFSFNLHHDFRCFVETAKEIIQIIEGLWEQKAAKEIEEAIEELFLPKPDPEEEEEDVEMVGLCDQFLQIRHEVLKAYEVESYYIWDRVIWISGMAGVGKTALAKKVLHDPFVKAIFQSRVFIRVGLNFGSIETILQAIIDQLNLDNGGMTQKSLLLLDDVWDPLLIYHLFHGTRLEKEEGIVVLLTSRTDSQYGPYFWMKMRFMDEEESWELLRRKVFGEEGECPPQLVKPGKKIAEKCEGLPLLINTVAPILLSKAQKNPECWNRVAHKPDSILEEASHQISQVLLTSYYQLREDEKLCFLYIASFPASCVVPRSTINNLWLVEGFTKHSWTYKDLICKNTVIDCQKSWSEAKAFKLHSSYWYVNNQYQVPICWWWKLLRVLLVLTIRFYEFPVEVVKLLHLKYLALTCNANLPPSISKLSNLEFLIVHQHLNIKSDAAHSYLPVEIWHLEKLIHLEITGRNLPNPPPGVVLSNLEGLFDVGVESCTNGVLKSLPKLKKLRIQIELAPDAIQTSSCFDHISSLFCLESFQSVIVNSTLSSPFMPLLNFGFNLRKLSLSGFGYPWEDMSKIAKMVYLEELKLECYAFRGEKWEAKEMRFPNLCCLLIEDTDLVQWTTGNRTFPQLRELTMKNCHKLREIPVGDMLHVELVDCNPLVETWAKQCYNCHVKYSWKEKVKSR